MTTKRDILDPTTDQDDLIIDAETVTQWVDNTLSTPHAASVDHLASKFPCLKEYEEDSQKIRDLAEQAFKPSIEAPSNTLARVLKAIKEEQKDKPAPSVSPADSQPSPETPQPEAPVEEQKANDSPFILTFPEAKKKTPYLWPIAALLFLVAFIGSIVHQEQSSDKDATLANTPSEISGQSIKKTRKAIIMSSDNDPHSARNKTTHLTNYNLTNTDRKSVV